MFCCCFKKEMSEETVSKFLLKNQSFARQWFIDNAKLLDLPAELSKGRNNELKYASTATSSMPTGAAKLSDILISNKKSPRTVDITSLEGKSEVEVLHELIRDINTELDLDKLCFKILLNVSILTKSDQGSLFLAAGPPNKRVLVSKLFNVSKNATMEQCLVAEENQFIIPFGKGIAGCVAETNKFINIKDCYKDSRFNQEIDKKTGYRTQALLCMPINDYDGELLGVAQIMNKTDGSEVFSAKDEKLFETYLGFCGIGLTNAQLFEMSIREYHRNELLLQLARNIFQEQTSLDKLVQSIMRDAQQVLDCQKCTIYLFDREYKDEGTVKTGSSRSSIEKHPKRKSFISLEDIKFSHVYELSRETPDLLKPRAEDVEASENSSIARFVAFNGQMLNIENAETHVDYKKLIKNYDGFLSRSLLSIPVFDSQGDIVGVMQLINKLNKGNKIRVFDENDCNTAKTFAVYIGLGLHNCQMYEHTLMLMAKQKVAFEVLSYHAAASQEEANKLASAKLPDGQAIKLYSWDYDDEGFSDEDLCLAAIRMFVDLDLLKKFNIPYEVLCRWTLSVKKNYRQVIYHNWRHAFNVAQSMFTALYSAKMSKYMTDLQMLALLVACLCHDLDHRGTNNTFQTKAESPLGQLYSTSTMEHHHFDQCIMILNSEGNNIFQGMPAALYRDTLFLVEQSILATDLALYFKKRALFEERAKAGEKTDWKEESNNEILRAVLMTACDVAAICKPWPIQYRVAHLVASEFFEQGDLERVKLGLEPIAMMDRQKKDELPKMQVGFIDFICLPLYSVLALGFKELKILEKKCKDNRERWNEASLKAAKSSSG